MTPVQVDFGVSLTSSVLKVSQPGFPHSTCQRTWLPVDVDLPVVYMLTFKQAVHENNTMEVIYSCIQTLKFNTTNRVWLKKTHQYLTVLAVFWVSV